MVANIEASDRLMDLEFGRETYLSYLPLAHSFERHCHYILLSRGATLAYGRGVDTLAKDLGEVKPTVMIGVPRVYEKFYDRVVAAVAAKGVVARRLFQWAVKQGTKRFYTGRNKCSDTSSRPFSTRKNQRADGRASQVYDFRRRPT